jgi:hypothetical protein
MYTLALRRIADGNCVLVLIVVERKTKFRVESRSRTSARTRMMEWRQADGGWSIHSLKHTLKHTFASDRTDQTGADPPLGDDTAGPLIRNTERRLRSIMGSIRELYDWAAALTIVHAPRHVHKQLSRSSTVSSNDKTTLTTTTVRSEQCITIITMAL